MIERGARTNNLFDGNVDCEKIRLSAQWKLYITFSTPPPDDSCFAPLYMKPRPAVSRFIMARQARQQTGLLPACCILESQWKLSSRACLCTLELGAVASCMGWAKSNGACKAERVASNGERLNSGRPASHWIRNESSYRVVLSSEAEACKVSANRTTSGCNGLIVIKRM